MTTAETATRPRSVLILGSGPVVIGQAAEFDYAGTQACRALRAEGIRTILVNSNPATIMTDPSVADVIYLEPLTVESVEAVIARERPDGLLAGLGGQTALNLAMALARAGVFERHPIKLLGTPLEAIEMAEDREHFRDLLDRIHQPYAPSAIVEGASPEERTASADLALAEIGLPAIVRPAFTLGGTGGGIVGHGSRVPRARPLRPAGEPDRPGDGRALPRGLAGDRVRGHARRRRHVHRRVLDGERRSARHPHRRLDRRRARPDADRRGPPAAPERLARDHPGARRGGRLQRPVRPVARLDRVRRHRGEPAGQSLVGAGVEGHRLPDRPGRRADRHRPAAGRDPERRDRHDRGGLRTRPRLRGRQAAALPVRQVPDRRSQPGQPDEGDRRGDGHRPDVRGGAQQGAPRPGAGRRRAAGRGPGVAAHGRLPGGGARRGSRRSGRHRRGAGHPDRLGGRRWPEVRIDPPGRALRRAHRHASFPRPVGLAAVADPRPAPARRPAARRRGGDRHRLVVHRRDGSQHRPGGGRGGGRRADRGVRRRRGDVAPRHGQASRLRRPRAGGPRRRGDGAHPGGPAGDRDDRRLRDGRHVRGRVRRRDALLLRHVRGRRARPRRRRRSSGPRRSSSARGRSGSARASSSTTAPSRPPTRSAGSAGAR